MDLDHDACYRALKTRDARFDGRLFVAVKTTGIYCRPVCPARLPRPENVVFYSTAAAAQENGYRPCLRCRPETAPDLAAWHGTSNTVSRALALIEMGALDGGDIAGLAERLGVGARQLHRLFRQHLGASPLAVAQTRRILLAKQLIHETSLRMSDIAMASGFGSIRRFNETFRQMYQRQPGALRRGSGNSVSPGAAVTVLLRYRPPYDWPAMIAFLRARAIPGVEIVSDEAYERTIDIGGARGVLRVRPAPGNALEANVHFPKLSALPSIIARLRRVFDLAADPEIIEAHLIGRSSAGAPGRSTAGVARPRCLGWVRAGRARHARPADHRRRRYRPGRPARYQIWRAAGFHDPRPRWADPRLPAPGGACSRRPVSRGNAQGTGQRAIGSRCGGCNRSEDLRSAPFA